MSFGSMETTTPIPPPFRFIALILRLLFNHHSSSQPPTPGLTSPMLTMELSSQESEIFFPKSSSTHITRRRAGRTSKRAKFHGNQHTQQQTIDSSSDDPSIFDSSADTCITKTKYKRFRYKLPRRGYSSKFSAPFPFRKVDVLFKTSSGTTSTKASIPTGMRLIDIGILAEAMTKIQCLHCSHGYLHLYESESLHGWQANYSIKCYQCHQLFAQFPSSRPMDMQDKTNFVNVHLPKDGLNEVTMRSVLSVHCSGFSWRDLHKFATIFDMPSPLEEMPPAYLKKIECIANIAVEESMQAAAEELHLKVHNTPSPISNCINTAVSFDSSWKTRGFYSNLGFGSAISATTKKVLDYVLFNRICEKCNRWSTERQNKSPEVYQKWYESHKDSCMRNFSGSSQSMEPEGC